MLSHLTLSHLVSLVSVLQRSRQHLHSEGKHVRQCESWTVLVLRLYLLVPGPGIKGHNCSGEQPVFLLPPLVIYRFGRVRGVALREEESHLRGKGEDERMRGWGVGFLVVGICFLPGASSLRSDSEEGKGSRGRQWHVTLGSATPHPTPHPAQQSMHETDIRSEEVSWKSPGAICVELKHSQLSATPATGMEGTEVSMEKREV